MSDDERPVFTLTEAAKVCRRRNDRGQWSTVSRKTIQRRLDADAFPNAYRLDGPQGDGSGPWVIPLADLLSEGFTPNASTPETSTDTADGIETAAGERDTDEAARLREQLAEAQAERDEQRHRADLAEQLAAERDRIIEAKDQTIRALEAGPRPASATESDTAPAAPRPRWWQRRK